MDRIIHYIQNGENKILQVWDYTPIKFKKKLNILPNITKILKPHSCLRCKGEGLLWTEDKKSMKEITKGELK